MSTDRGTRKPLVADRRQSQPPRKAGGGTGGSGGGPRKPGRTRRAAPAKKRGPVGWFLYVLFWPIRILFKIGLVLGLVTALIVGVAVWTTASDLPPADQLIDGRTRGSVTMLDRGGEVFAWRGDQFGGAVTADTVSRHLRNAVVATEDKRFYAWYHPGIDFYGTGAAMIRNYRTSGDPLSGAGGSSITQQTAKLLCFGEEFDPEKWETEAAYEADCRETTLARKIREAIYAMAMESRYTKDEILTIYLNRAYLGAGARGFEAASQRYFGKSAAEVNPAEAAMLAGLLRAPSYYDPTRNLQRARDRGETVLMLMHDSGYLSDSALAEARANPAELSSAAQAEVGGYFADWVMQSGPEFFTRDTTEDVIIRTTLDPEMQRDAEEALQWIFDNKVREGSEAQAAIVVMSADGAVRAMVGGRATRVSGVFNRATQAMRQTGSSFKPFVYATALDFGLTPIDVVDDVQSCWNIPGSGQWCPENYTNDFRGPVSLTEALVHSLNIPAVKVAEIVGLEQVVNVTRGFGIDSEVATNLAVALGASESTLLEMTGAYAGILNGGSAVEPYGLVDLRLMGDSEPIMGSGGGIRDRVIREEAARQLTWMMYQAVERGTGQRARIDGWEIAGKTGTTSAARDAWFIGFTGEYVAGVWMGYDDNTPLTGVTGGGLPAEIWHETMRRILEGRSPTPLPMTPPPQAGTIVEELPLSIPQEGGETSDLSPPPGQVQNLGEQQPQALGGQGGQGAQGGQGGQGAQGGQGGNMSADDIAEQVLIDVLTDILREANR